MSKQAPLLAWTLVLALGLGLLAIPAGMAADEEEEYAKVKTTILKMADMKDADAKKAAEKLAKDAFLEDIMRVFKPRRTKGIGVGPSNPRDGIEYKIIFMASKDPMSKEELAKEAKDLVMMSKHARAVSDLLPHYAPKKASDKAKWEKYAQQMRSQALALGKAAESGDPAAVKKVAVNLDAACKDCHADFRD
jgi:hypothetical protein